MNFSRMTPSGCEVDLMMGKRLQKPSSVTLGLLIFIIIVNIITFPLTATLNALVMIAVKTKSQLRAHKLNILLAMLASTDFQVGIILKPVFATVLVLFLLDELSGHCLVQSFRPVSGLFNTSLFHLALISGEQYIAIKHCFVHSSLVTEALLMAASAIAWPMTLFSAIGTVALSIANTLVFISISFIVFCHVTVYREIRRHEKQMAVQQVTKQAREKFEKDRKALKLTSIILGLLFLCITPLMAFATGALKYHSET